MDNVYVMPYILVVQLVAFRLVLNQINGWNLVVSCDGLEFAAHGEKS